MTAQRGRPRTFDQDKVLEQAQALFWERGYPATSYSDLCTTTGLSKPSLYAAFGNKETTFLAALDRYRADHILPALASLEAEPDARRAVLALIAGTVDRFVSGPGGCMIATNAACAGAPDVPAEVTEAVMRAGTETTKALAARLERARAEGQLPADADIPAFVSFVATVIQGLAARAKIGTSRVDLIATVETAMRAWPG